MFNSSIQFRLPRRWVCLNFAEQQMMQCWAGTMAASTLCLGVHTRTSNEIWKSNCENFNCAFSVNFFYRTKLSPYPPLAHSCTHCWQASSIEMERWEIESLFWSLFLETREREAPWGKLKILFWSSCTGAALASCRVDFSLVSIPSDFTLILWWWMVGEGKEAESGGVVKSEWQGW